MNFVKPGFHSVFIYDPETAEFYQKLLIINFKSDDPNPLCVHPGKQTVMKTGHTPMHSGKSKDSREHQLSRKFSVVKETIQEQQLFSVKPYMSERDLQQSVVWNFQQPDYSQEILQENMDCFIIQIKAVAERLVPTRRGSSYRSLNSMSRQNARESVHNVKQDLARNFEFLINLYQYLQLTDETEYFFADFFETDSSDESDVLTFRDFIWKILDYIGKPNSF